MVPSGVDEPDLHRGAQRRFPCRRKDRLARRLCRADARRDPPTATSRGIKSLQGREPHTPSGLELGIFRHCRSYGVFICVTGQRTRGGIRRCFISEHFDAFMYAVTIPGQGREWEHGRFEPSGDGTCRRSSSRLPIWSGAPVAFAVAAGELLAGLSGGG